MAPDGQPYELLNHVLNGELWLTSPVTVVYDDGDRLAVRLDPGSTFTFPSHSVGVHPCAPDGLFRHWYINFEAPLKRGPGHIDTDDYGLDLILDSEGQRQWKDVSDLHHQRTEGRISPQTVLAFSPRRHMSKQRWTGKIMVVVMDRLVPDYFQSCRFWLRRRLEDAEALPT